MVIGKSGTNQSHGTLFEFFRNEDLNARNYFAQPAEARISAESIRTDGGRADPEEQDVLLCRLAGHAAADRHHALQRVPTVAQRGGVFTTTIYDPATSPRTPFANNTIPTSRFDPIATADPAALSGAERCRARTTSCVPRVEPDNQDQFDGRIDHVFSEKHRVFGRYSFCAMTTIR